MSALGPHRPMRRSLIPALAALLAAGFITLGVATTVWQQDRLHDEERSQLASEARDQHRVLDDYFARSASLTQLLAQNPAFKNFYRLPGTRLQRVRRNSATVREANAGLAYLEKLFPGRIGEACFIDDSGAENARAVRGEIAPISDLSLDEAAAPFFKPTFALRPGQVYQARPYVSPDTREWVIANATPVRLPAAAGQAIVHFEVTVESFRHQAAAAAGDLDVAVVDGRSGKVVLDTANPQPLAEHRHPGGGKPHVHRLAPLGPPRYPELVGSEQASGYLDVGGKPAAFAQVGGAPHNANDWIVVVSSPVALPSWVESLGAAQIALIVLALVLLVFAVLSFRSSQRALEEAVLTDPLTGLGNRRKLVRDLQRLLECSSPDDAVLLAIFDLDGFKAYNDSFGHPAGDALLIRLATALEASLASRGGAYRIGGDEFCVLSSGDDSGQALALAAAALTEEGDGFSITSSHGCVVMPKECTSADEGLRIADHRMYAVKGANRTSAGRQTTDVLVRVLAERYPDLYHHNSTVSELCAQVVPELGIPVEERLIILQAASVHDIGKIAIPDSILQKPGPLDESEWDFIRQHTLIGERILATAPSLAAAAKLVRSSHERIDGGGYPDGLAGEAIPLGARIICVCDAFRTMVAERPYSPRRSIPEALAELRRCAGTQFDPRVVEAVVAVVDRRSTLLTVPS